MKQRRTTGWLVVQLLDLEKANHALTQQIKAQEREIKNRDREIADLTSARDYLAKSAQRLHRERSRQRDDVAPP